MKESYIQEILRSKLYENMSFEEMEQIAKDHFKEESLDYAKAVYLHIMYSKLPDDGKGDPWSCTEYMMSMGTFEGGGLTDEEYNMYANEGDRI